MKLRTRLIIGFMTVMILPTLFTTVGMRILAPQRVSEMQFLLLVVIFLTAAIFIMWIYRAVNIPIHKMQDAAKQIKEGNLDFELKVDEDDEMGQLCRDFEEMRLRLKDNAEEKVAYDKESKELISNISHDLKTPITAIKGYVEGIMDGVADTPEKMDRYIKTIYNKANEMDRLINELTLYSKIDTNRIPYNFSTLSAQDYFDDCAEDLALELEAKGVLFIYHNYMEEDSRIIVDAEQLRRVVNNIVNNSLKYMDKPQGKINMTIRDVGDFIQVELADNGKGIAPKDLPNVFDRFYRTDASRNSSKGGSGIGLAIVKKIVEEHGGNIWATSQDGVGTTMYFVLRKYQEVPVDE
ncbi:sensor histidine kinase [Hespellia stercorisuis]|uniref:histidine kinase n=1 Tax=Hespellia stercorisuis DSM 15480 TaxID=1121950 RepID=A0A1M6NG29_9FIRM|nr:HAMP domain-containing sensor histidine kinase [Hespellia stercorisuis]SHJ94721.1 HAMP domain-containing protein [Hespellia stercorisuis DSM 15480]